MSKTTIISLKRIGLLLSYFLLVTPALFMEAVADPYPVDMLGATPEEASVVVDVNKPSDAINGIITLSVYDADFPTEGELVINGNKPVALFGSKGIKANDKNLSNIKISTPASYWNDGDNTLLFRHKRTAGYSIN